MWSHENKIRICFGTGLCIFIIILVWAGVIFIRDMVSLEENAPVSLGDALPAGSGSQNPGEAASPQPSGAVPQNPSNHTAAVPVSNEAPALSAERTVPVSREGPSESPNPPVPTYPAYPISSRMTRTERMPRPEQRSTLIFVIDDAGHNLQELEPFLHFPGPLTIAVLPGLSYSAEAARRIRAAGKELILHQPMEAIGGQDPGPGAVYVGMSPGEIRAIVERNLAEIGPVAGMNNHQGSKVTMDATAVETILTLCHEQGIYFLDSRTTADTVVPAVAARLGIPIEERDVFLDNIQQKAAMIRYVNEGLEKADRRGIAVMIGHTWSTELAETLTALYPDLIARGYSLATISRLWKTAGEGRAGE